VKHPLKPIFLLILCAVPLAPACVTDRPVTALRDGPRECVELERRCKAPADAFGEPYLHCYETGKAKVSNACINYYYDCIDSCRAASGNIGQAGQGGEGGAAGANANAGAGAGAGGA